MIDDDHEADHYRDMYSNASMWNVVKFLVAVGLIIGLVMGMWI